ncbi:MAG TPA: hypothetical protein VHA79_15585 [Mycobacteriales bacterium]|jgi:hypothetical protein|nr:hypothetical protein [Mycobacteriales bacterium]HVX71106.1 hypothetical protein [Mycobacteriales bacterium]
MSVHQCPKCQLRYLYRAEVELHLREDHRETAPETDVDVDTPTPASTTGPARREAAASLAAAR